MKLIELVEIRNIGKFSGKNIFYIVVFFYVTSLLYYMWHYSLGTPIGEYMYDHNMSVIFAPIYEEVLFRGIILIGLLRLFKNKSEVIIWSGILFGIWHFKNFPYISIGENIHQVIYTAFLGGFFAGITLKYKTIWIGVILHYINNIFLHPVSWFLVGYFNGKIL